MKARRSNVSKPSTLRVNEIFVSIQGEGILMGTPSTFVRLAGCNLHCKWCDTPYALAQGVGDSILTVKEIVDQITTKHVVITGGEPLIQSNVKDLADLCDASGHIVTIETNGTIYRERLRWPVYLFSVSPKLGSSGHEPNRDVLNKYCANTDHYYRLQIKFVVADAVDFEEAFLCIVSLHHEWSTKDINFVLQPEGLSADRDQLMERLQHLIDATLSNKSLCAIPSVQVLPQLHRLLWGQKRGI